MKMVRTRVIALGASALATGAVATAALAPAAGAQAAASSPVLQAIDSQKKLVNPYLTVLNHLEFHSKAQARTYLPKLAKGEQALDHAATVVSRAHATSATQKLGQRDWVAGVRDLGRCVGQLRTAVADYVKGDETKAVAEIQTAKQTLKEAAAIGKKGAKLLGVTPVG